jgi:ATP-dependent DNA helicase RecG
MKTKTTKRLNSIVIGDVGSGKTIVGFLTALTYLKNLPGGQVCLLAPTEILAYQHYTNLLLFKNSLSADLQADFPTVVFASAKKNSINGGEKITKKKLEKNISKRLIEFPDSKIFWIGTHSLLHSKNINPNLVMVDEQHKFGVLQRQKLNLKQVKNPPHFISFSATPIPRTMALTVFANLNPHFLETLPGRNKIDTRIEFFEKFDEKIIPIIQNRLDSREKIYVVCTKIDPGESEDEETFSTTKVYAKLSKFFENNVLEVHGKMAEKKEILEEFKNSKTKNILVTTTVVEVGVDIPEATLMIILNAEKYGLAALHQLRGRVGRNNKDNNSCLLVTWQKYKGAKRLDYLNKYESGFILAQKDLELRGSGSLYGEVQSGFAPEVEAMIGLDPEMYEEIARLVKNLDIDNLSENGLSRLERYLKKEQKKIWEE